MMWLAGARGLILEVASIKSRKGFYSGQEHFYFVDNARVFELRNDMMQSAF